MSNLVQSGVDGFLPATTDRQSRRAIAEIDRRASVIEAAAQRKMAMAHTLGHTAKLHVAAAVGFSNQLKQVVPEAGQLFDTLDTQMAMSLADTLNRALR